MLWPRLSPERSCVCCRSRRRLGRLRARPASHCNLDRVVFRYQNERRSRLLAASSYCATGIDLFGNPASPVFSPAPGPIRTARNGLSAVGRCGHGRTSRLPRRTLWVRFRFQSGVQGRGPLGLQYVDSVSFAQIVAIPRGLGGRAKSTRSGSSSRGHLRKECSPELSFLNAFGRI